MSEVEVPELSSIVDGREVLKGPLAEDINPSRPSEVVATYRTIDAAGAGAAVAVARSRARGWSRTPAPARGVVLRRVADLIERDLQELAIGLAREEGKTLPEAMGETQRAADIFRFFAGRTLDPNGVTFASHARDVTLTARRAPLGVVSVITPWNFPIAIPAWKIAPALAFGNTVVWKPADLVPLTSWRLASLLREAGLPDGVLNLVLGRGSTVGDALISSGVDGLTFTGSNDVGRRLRVRAAEFGVASQFEMGGSNPAVVLEDADIRLAAEHVARAAFISTGQRCTATSRLVVDVSVRDALIDAIGRVTAGWRVGDALDPTTTIGPLASKEQLERVGGLVSSSVAGGSHSIGLTARVDASDGFFMAPRILLLGDGQGSLFATEEAFGPVLEVRTASGYGEAVHLANDTDYGLVASIFTNDLGRAAAFVEDAQAGVVKVNQESTGLEFHVPFGGAKGSSSGPKEQGNAAVEFFTSWKTAYVHADGAPGAVSAR